MRPVWFVVVLVASACACSRQRAFVNYSAPDPTGCFVQVYEKPEFAGAREFLNGPHKYATLGNLPGGVSWRNRIRSLRVGPAITTVTLWTDEVFSGSAVRLGPDRPVPRLHDAFAGQVESLEIACSPQPMRSALTMLQ
jgi:hypothetical protein